MRCAIIGHRGVGKSTLLRRIEAYYAHENRQVECIDLDREIEKNSRRSVNEIFSSDGEQTFRRIEHQTFSAIDRATASARHDVFLACGAGFFPSEIPKEWKVLWIRRSTDSRGRIFTDRPRLDKTVSPLEEFNQRYQSRQNAYSARADEVLWIDEGLEGLDASECGFILDDLSDVGGAVTLQPEIFRDPATLAKWIEKRVRWDVDWFELRDDILNHEQIGIALKLIPHENILLSFRDPSRQAQTANIAKTFSLNFDWPVEWGPCKAGRARYLSLHERKPGQTIAQTLARFPQMIDEGAELKAAIPVHDFSELREAHQWREVFPEARVLLPISQDGRWSWYRLLQSRRQSLGFFKESEGSAADQPTLLQWVRASRFDADPLHSEIPHFAAVLGDPVAHSRTPMEQYDFFASQGFPVYAIRVTEDEWREQKALEFLKNLGLRKAAITAPLKTAAYESSLVHDRVSEILYSLNTMSWSDERNLWEGVNTDLTGFRKAVESVQPDVSHFGHVAVWGGGGTLNVVRAVFSKAQFFSIRTKENRDPKGPRAADFQPQTLVWCAGRGRAEQPLPPASWRPNLVIDLNYTEDSPGRAYALKNECRYISGLTMFREQAEAQRGFWRRHKGERELR